MASSVGDSVAKRKINDLRVIDIKEQLELRGLEKTGVKAALIERLKKAVEEEGLDPEEYLFEIDIKKVTKPESKDMENEDEELGGDVNKTANNVKKCGAITDNGDVSMETNVDEDISTGQPDQDSVISSTPVKAGNPETVEPSSNSMESFNLGDELNLNADNQSNTDVVDEASQKHTTDMEQTQSDVTIQSQNISMDTEDGQPAESKTPEKNEEHETDIDASTTLDNEQQQQQPTAATELPSGEMLEPPSPDSVPVVVPFTKDDLKHMDTSADRQVDEDISLIVHIDESQMDLDNDLLNTPAKQSDPAKKSEDSPTTSMTSGEAAHIEEGGKDLEEKKGKSEEKEEGEAVAEQSGGETGPPENEQKSVTSQSKDGDKAKSLDKTSSKDGKAKSVSSSSRSLWISGLASSTRATDLKTLFSKYGKVAGAKVVTNAKSPGSRCYGFVTMNTADEASKCIQHLHRTELHGKMISVERAKGDPSAQAKTVLKGGAVASQKKEEHTSRGEKRDVTHEKRRSRHRSSGRSREHERHHSRRSSGHRSPGSVTSSRATRERDTKERESKDRKSSKDKDQKSKDKDILDFEKIKAERERERLKQRERQMREEERRRMRELERMRERQHDIERRQKEEAMRLEREKQKLRLEQQRLERERLEAERERIALERERQRRERENLEREREQERLHQLRLEQERRAMKRNYDARPGAREEFWSDPKRLNLERGPRYEDRPGGDVFMRRIERYDRRDGRPIDPVLPRAPDRFEGRRDDKHEIRRPPGPHRDTKDRDDRGRGTDDRGRSMRYPDRRDGPPGREHDRGRHERDRSPHAPAHPNGPPHHGGPPRSSPAHRQADSRADWKSERNPPVREGRGRGCGVGGGALGHLPSSAERGFGEGRGSGGRDSWHINRAGKPNAQDNCAQPSGYNSGIGGRPGGMGHDWNSGDRGAPASGPNVSSRPGDRGWTGAPSQGADRVGVRPQPAALAVQQPLLQTPPTSAAFLASATNIMMGVGLGGSRNSTQEARYDAYKTIQGGNVGRY